ncbi:MAG: bacteriophage holin [Candidatus Omnitrophica bacterium]|nr:bacteriophage holin [Candidatus Omnitrophota bacterium]MCF7876830.1 bacteriophage holin [Candidatus Omnitrophota bacterium]MCF7878124.1 bacteriophage holin [Candidatus Omnitrophota bacterium]MCF7892971.1 bacteriophage holin [Candidatus Omnitrophota bacterium]MCF7898245.1 bacteriophage holin [Candidatus Omnitrophota bacterium]
MKLKISAFGFALGIVWGLIVFLLGVVGMLFSFGTTWVLVLASLYLGYATTVLGSLIGGLWGFLTGFLGGVVFAWLYNKLPGK